MNKQEIALQNANIILQDLEKIRLLKYDELSKQEQANVQNYMDTLNEEKLLSINEYGKEVFKKFDDEAKAIIQNLDLGTTAVGDAEADLLVAMDKMKGNEKNFLGRILNKTIKATKKANHKLTTTVENLPEIISEKQEKYRNELKQHYFRLLQVSENSERERYEREILLIAARRKYDEIKLEIEELEQKGQLTYEETKSLMRKKFFLNALVEMIENNNQLLSIVTRRAIDSQNLAYAVNELARKQEQDYELIKQDLRSEAIFAISRKVVGNIAETHEQMRKSYNEMALQSSKEVYDTIVKIQGMKGSSLLEKETVQKMFDYTIEGTQIIKDMYEQKLETPTISSEQEKTLEEFTQKMQQIKSTVIPIQSEIANVLPNEETER